MPPISYSKGFATWLDKPSTATPTSADKYNNFETGISQLYELYNAAGDLAVGAGADTLDRLAAPTTNDHVLVADTAQTLKMKWGQIDNDSISASAAIAYSKLNIAGLIDSDDLGIAWSTSYTPNLTASGGGFSLGSGGNFAQEGAFIQIGPFALGYFYMRMGNSGQAAGSGNYSLNLPVTVDVLQNRPLGAVWFFDDNLSDSYVGLVTQLSATTAQLRIAGGEAQQSATFPVAPAASDIWSGILILPTNIP